MRLLVGKYNLKDDKGSVLMEAIICLPVLLLLSLGVAQFAHIWYCRTIVHYAAYCGARAVLTAIIMLRYIGLCNRDYHVWIQRL